MERREYSEQFEKQKFADLIMTAKEYAELGGHNQPYRYELGSGEKELIYLGVAHSSNPEAESFKTIKHDLEEIKPDLVMVEGLQGINSMPKDKLKEMAAYYSTDEDIIRNHGEAAYTMKIAIERGIQVISPEPPNSDKIKFILAQGISKEAIFAEDMATLLHQYNWLEEKPNLKEYLKRYMEEFQKDTQWDNFDFSLEHYEQLHKKYTGKSFDINDTETIERLNDPIPWGNKEYNVVNQVAALSSLYRDRYMVEEIEKKFENVDKIYIVFGASHAVMQQPALRKLMESYGK